MMKSQPVLDLYDYVVDQLSVNNNPSFDEEQPVDAELKIVPSVAQHKDDPLMFRVGLDLRTRSSARRNTPYTIGLRIFGFFSFAASLTEEDRQRMLGTNALPILYGVARGIVGQVTAQGPSGKFILPTVNFLEILRREAERAVAVLASERTELKSK